MAPRSFVWEYFAKCSDKTKVKCNLCKKIVDTSGGSTKGLITHLKSIHKIIQTDDVIVVDDPNDTAFEKSNLEPPKKIQKTINDLMMYRSLEETIARLICQDNFNFNQIAKSSFVREALQIKFPRSTIPKNPSGVTKLLLIFYENIKKKTIEKIQVLLLKGKFFSATLDEWTSTSLRKYLNINIHYSENNSSSYINLGMVRIQGSCDTIQTKALVSNNEIYF